MFRLPAGSRNGSPSKRYGQRDRVVNLEAVPYQGSSLALEHAVG